MTARIGDVAALDRRRCRAAVESHFSADRMCRDYAGTVRTHRQPSSRRLRTATRSGMTARPLASAGSRNSDRKAKRMVDSFGVALTIGHDRARLRLRGELDIAAVDELAASFDEACAAGPSLLARRPRRTLVLRFVGHSRSLRAAARCASNGHRDAARRRAVEMCAASSNSPTPLNCYTSATTAEHNTAMTRGVGVEVETTGPCGPSPPGWSPLCGGETYVNIHTETSRAARSAGCSASRSK